MSNSRPAGRMFHMLGLERLSDEEGREEEFSITLRLPAGDPSSLSLQGQCDHLSLARDQIYQVFGDPWSGGSPR